MTRKLIPRFMLWCMGCSLLQTHLSRFSSRRTFLSFSQKPKRKVLKVRKTGLKCVISRVIEFLIFSQIQIQSWLYLFWETTPDNPLCHYVESNFCLIQIYIMLCFWHWMQEDFNSWNYWKVPHPDLKDWKGLRAFIAWIVLVWVWWGRCHF